MSRRYRDRPNVYANTYTRGVQKPRSPDRGDTMNALPLLLSHRAAAKLLGIGRGDSLASLIKSGLIRPVILLGKSKIPREQIEQLARTGEPEHVQVEAKPKRTPKRKPSDTEAVAAIDLDSL